MRIFLILSILLLAGTASADTIYLKNGGILEGVIEKEDGNSVEVNMGFGTVTFSRSQIKSINKSSAEESDNLVNKWSGERKELAAKEKEFSDARDKRFKDAYENWTAEARQKAADEKGPVKDVRVAHDENSRHIIVEALLNDKVRSVLVLDTGASLVILSKRIGDELGIDTSDTSKDIVTLKLADGRMSKAKAVVLDSVKIDDVEARSIMAAVMIDQLPDPGLKDGLLGMSFLSKFNIQMDLKTMKMSLERLEKQESPK